MTSLHPICCVVNKSVSSQLLRTLTTWHCPRSMLRAVLRRGCAAERRHCTAANPPRRRATAEWCGRRTVERNVIVSWWQFDKFSSSHLSTVIETMHVSLSQNQHRSSCIFVRQHSDVYILSYVLCLGLALWNLALFCATMLINLLTCLLTCDIQYNVLGVTFITTR